MKVAIIGGGPVGLVMALHLEKHGHQIDLYEKGKWPRDKACGQGIMPSGIKELSDLGVDFTFGKDCMPFSGISYKDGEISVEGTLAERGYGIERTLLSQKIISKIKEKENIFLYSDTKVLETFNQHDQFEIKVESGIKSYDYAFACDGLNSSLRQKYNNQKIQKQNLRMGAREHFNQTPWSDKVEVYWNDRVEAYVTPVSENKIEVAFLWFQKQIEQGQNLRLNLWAQFPELKNKVKFENSQRDFKGYGPFSTRSKKIKVGRLFFLGDAFCFLDGITGEGLSLGFKSSKIVAQNFHRWDFSSELKFKLLYWHYSLMIKLALSLSRKKRWRRFIFKIFGRLPKSFDTMLSLNDLLNMS